MAVLAVVYLIFNEGYGGRGDLAAEAIRLGRALSELMPDEPEVQGLLALMLLLDAHRETRFRDGELVLLADQAALCGELSRLTGSPVVELDRAAAVAESEGPEAGLRMVDRLDLDDYRYLHSTRGELLRRLGRMEEAREAYRRALALVHDDAARRLLQRRLAELDLSAASDPGGHGQPEVPDRFG